MSLPPQLECVDSFHSGNTTESSPKIVSHERGLNINVAADVLRQMQLCRKCVRSQRQGLHFEFNQNHDRQSTSDTNQQLQEELTSGYTIDLSDAAAIRALLTPTEHSKVLRSEKPKLLETIQRLRENDVYMKGEMDQLCAENKQVWRHNSELLNKLKRLEMENIELRRNIEAPKSELNKATTNTQQPKAVSNVKGKEGKRSRDGAGSELLE
ncbi:hypothetical protein V493_01523 [Pseudogymnoascus sp. VKM F-4281 (FW-2241)]|nr:hypothetical protein V493_01523 [Pseudogymnoascus sp. VKM F-4281 (FW-2241)]